MQPVNTTPVAPLPSFVELQGRLPMPRHFTRVAVIHDASLRIDPEHRHPGAHFTPTDVHSSASDAARHFMQVATRLGEDGLVTFYYFETTCDGPDASLRMHQAFDAIARMHAQQVCDAILILGNPAVPADIGCIHQVLAPRIASAGLPVLTALGEDDAQTILGDIASAVFVSCAALIDFLAAEVERQHPSPQVLRTQLQSVASFLLEEQEVATTILMQTGVVPALQQHLQQQVQETDRTGQHTRKLAVVLEHRLAREATALQHCRRQIATQLIRLADPARGQMPHRPARGISLGLVRCLFAGFYAGVIALLWYLTSPARAVFFGGCLLVLASALYVAITNVLLDARDAAADQAQASHAAWSRIIERQAPYVRALGALSQDVFAPRGDAPYPLKEPPIG